jgi:rhodanese-related sulfurtransferase
VQTANEQLPDDEPYTVHWMAMQMSPDAAAG